jgi:hypothetical protein
MARTCHDHDVVDDVQERYCIADLAERGGVHDDEVRHRADLREDLGKAVDQRLAGSRRRDEVPERQKRQRQPRNGDDQVLCSRT